MFVIKESFTKEDIEGGAICVTPQSFSAVKSWTGAEVTGLKYYVDKAVGLGAIKPKQKRQKKVEAVEEAVETEE